MKTIINPDSVLKKIGGCLLLTILAMPGKLYAQTFQDFASSYKQSGEVKEGQLTFRFESLGFFRNNEYTGSIVAGYTLTGAMVRPKLTYSPVAGMYIEAGAHLLKYNGMNEQIAAAPWFSARYRFSERFSVVTGNLDQNNMHGLPEQLWEPERIYTDKPEAGLQFLYSGNKLNAQTWISWEQFIQKNDPFQEHFTFGLTGDYQAFKNSALSVKLPVQILMYHRGGEINIAPEGGERPGVQTHGNFAAGWEMSIPAGKKIKTINLNGYWFGYKAITRNSNTLPFNEGHAYLLETSAQTRNSRISLSYWDSFQFIAPKGRLLYQSVSDINPMIVTANHDMVSAKYLWQKNIDKNARVAFQAEADVLIARPVSSFSYSYGFFLLLNTDFFITSTKH